MRTIPINVEGLPRPVIEAVEALARMVEALRRDSVEKTDERPHVELPVWPGKVIGPLTRDEIYKDVD